MTKTLGIFILLVLSTLSVQSQETRKDTIVIRDTIYIDGVSPVGYEKKQQRLESAWNKLIPKYNKVQFAGSMGLISIGTGWNYGKNKQWETDLLFGIVPRYSTKHTRVTMTVKQNFIPWSVQLGNSKFHFKPFSTGLYLNTVFGSDYWGKQPSKYPNAYYTFSTKLRTNIFIGQGWEFKLDTRKKVLFKSITFFYELSTNELYIISAFSNRYLKAKDFLGLSFGVKIQVL